MKHILYTITFLCIGNILLLSQSTARIQFIHNVPLLGTETGPVYDVYMNGISRPELRSFSFRSATTFLQYNTGEPLVLDLRMAPSTAMDPIVKTFQIGNLNPNRAYTIMLGGVDLPIPQLPQLTAFVNQNALDSNSDPDRVHVNIAHGGILLPPVTAEIRPTPINFQVSYGQFSNYGNLLIDDYFMSVNVQNLGFPLSYRSDFRSLGGKAATIFISGAAVNNPEWGLFMASSDGQVTQLPLTLLAEVQFIQNIGTDPIDVYIGEELFIDNFEYRSATPYVLVEAERLLDFGMAPANSAGPQDIFAVGEAGFETDGFFTVTFNGIRDDSSFPPVVANHFQDKLTADDVDEYDFTLFHGLQDSLVLRAVLKQGGTLVDSIAPNNYSPYFSRPASDTSYLDILDFQTGEILYTFILGLPEFLSGNAISLVLSGTPENNDVSLIAFYPDGSAITMERLDYAIVQYINNIPNTQLALFADDLPAHPAVPFSASSIPIDLLSGVEIKLNVRSGFNSIFTYNTTFSADSLYYSIYSGLSGSSVFPISVHNYASDGPLEVQEGEVGLICFNGVHGSDSLSVEIVGGASVFDKVRYEQFEDSSSIEVGIYFFDVMINQQRLTFEADLSNESEQEILLLFSGNLSSPETIQLTGIRRDGSLLDFRETSVARVQWIHNLSGIPIDLYVNDSLLISNFTPISATAYLNLEVGDRLIIGVAPIGSQSVQDSIKSFSLDLVGGKSYQLLFNGLPESDPSLFDLFVLEDRRETSDDPGVNQLAIFNGAFLNEAFAFDQLYHFMDREDLDFGALSDYIELPAEYSIMSIESNQGSFTYSELDLRGIEGQSGLLIWTYSEDSAFELQLILVNAAGEIEALPNRTVSTIQLINNREGSALDMRLNGTSITSTVNYRTATNYRPIVVNHPITISLDENDVPLLIRQEALLESVHHTWIVGDDQGGAGPSLLRNSVSLQGLDIESDSCMASIVHSAVNTGNIDFTFRATQRSETGIQPGIFVLGTQLPAIAQFVELESVTNSFGGLYYGDLSDFGGQLITIWTSKTSSESNWTIWASDPNGITIAFSITGVANVQLLNNSPFGHFDLFVAGEPLRQNLSYLLGTGFLDVPAGVPIPVEVKFSGSSAVAWSGDILLESDSLYQWIITGFPGNNITPLELLNLPNAKTRDNQESRVNIRFFHGASDSGPLKFDTRNFVTLVELIAYKESTDYVSISPMRLLIDLKDGLSQSIINSFEGDFSSSGGRSIVLFASGVEGDPDFPLGLFLWTDSGLVVPLTGVSLANVQFVHNAGDQAVDIYYAGELLIPEVQYRNATGFIPLPAFPGLSVSIAKTGDPIEDSFIEQELNLVNGQNYILMVNGIVPNPDPEFPVRLDIFEGARTVGTGNESVDFLFAHASPGLPGFDLFNGSGLQLARDLRYSEFSQYQSLPADDYVFSVRTSGTGALIQDFREDFSDLGGQSVLIFASGAFLGEPGFELWAALTNGATFPLEIVVSTKETSVHSKIELFPNPANSYIQIKLPGILGTTGTQAVTIFNAVGQVYYQGSLDNNNWQTVNLGSWQSGIYWIRTVDPTGQTLAIPFIKH